MNKAGFLTVAVVAALLAACGGGIRHSFTAPEAKDLRLQTIAVLPGEAGPYKEAGPAMDDIVAREIQESRDFRRVVSPGQVRAAAASDSRLRRDLQDFQAKLAMVNFSDPELSRRLGEAFQVEALLLTGVDRWDYGTEGDDKVARVGLHMRLIQAGSGRVLWTANHLIADSYVLRKPDLPEVAGRVARAMIGHMPR